MSGKEERDGIYRAGRNSSRISWRSSSIQSNKSTGNKGSCSTNSKDGEEARRWDILQKLPTYDRLRKGILMGSIGMGSMVDIRHLGFQERHTLMERLIMVAEEDHERFLLKLKERFDRVGIVLPTVEVRYEHLSVEAKAYVGSRALPTFFNFFLNKVEGLLDLFHIISSRKQRISILEDISGIIQSCRMTLLLGPPSSGKTTLLLALAGRLNSDLKTSGTVTYNGYHLNEFVPQRTAAYVSQHDLHIGEMTVRETLAFSARCQGVGTSYDLLAELSRREKAANIQPDPDIDVFLKAAATEGQETNVITDYVIKILGLEVCADTIVGDEMLRGISGGQRKRVTTGEILVGPAMVLLMDEISTGLDSSTTYQIVNSLKQITHILKKTAVISLLQPAPETYNLFDDIILMSDGQIVYHGSRELVLDFFESMGFQCPERKGVADFLQEVTSKKDQQQYWVREEPYHFITAQEFAESFKSFHVGKELAEKLSTPFNRSKNHPAALTTKKYGVRKKELLKANIKRECILMKRNSFVYLFRLIMIACVACVSMTFFLRTNMPRNTIFDGGIYVGALFFTVTTVMFNGMSEMPMTIAKLPVFHKQRDQFFYPAWSYSLPLWILKIPISLVETGLFVCLSYYVVGYDPDVGRFFKQLLVLALVHQMASGLFRMLAGVSRDMVVASTVASFFLLALFALSGVVLSREQVKKWWMWGYWVSPMTYGQNAIIVNEFLGKSWNHVPPNSTESLGVQVLKSRGFFPYAYWYWIGVGALFGFILIFNFGFFLSLAYLKPYGQSRTLKSDNTETSTEGTENPDHEGGSNHRHGERRRTRFSSWSSSTYPESALSFEGRRGMVLPFKQHSITFDEIIYSVDNKSEERQSQGITEDKLVLLKGVSGAFRPGVLTALMGVSGAGKTTLMDVLAGRKTGGYIEGTITISGYPKRQEAFTRIAGYCEQNDIHSPHVTVYESLVYSAWLRLPSDIDKNTRKMFIEEVMGLVELNSLREALVGFPGVDGLSTEQRKRLTIAVELVANPSIIFMDEPTSGLDARAAAIVMRAIRNTVDTGRTVVCTIHQPSIDIFEAFDELFLMKAGGQEIYVGPLGSDSSKLIEYFEGIEGVGRIKDMYNPATWMLEVTSRAQEMALGIDFADLYKKSDLYRRNKELIRELNVPAPGSKDLSFPTQYSQPFFTQFMACFWKQRWSYWRNPRYTAVQYLLTILIGLMFGSMFWDLGSRRRTPQDLTNAMGSMYAAIIFMGTSNCHSVQPLVSIERTVFYRERAAGMYSALPYAFAQILIETPYILMQAGTYGLLVYAMIGFEWTAVKFFWYIFFMYFTLLYFTLYGMMAVAVTSSYQMASIIGTFFYGLWNLSSGFIIPRTRIPIWWRWYYWACPVSWSLYGLVGSQFGDVKATFDDGQPVADYVRDYLGYEHDFIGVVAVVVVGFCIVFSSVFAISIKILNFQNR